jgi:anthranilate phosphoribosyltransferase
MHSWIVNSIGSLDEIGLKGVTRVVDVSADGVKTIDVTAADFGIDDEGDIPLDLSALESASLIIDLLDNEEKGSASERLVLMNAAAAIHITGRSHDLEEAYSIAEQSVRSGAAFDKLAALREGRQ